MLHYTSNNNDNNNNNNNNNNHNHNHNHNHMFAEKTPVRAIPETAEFTTRLSNENCKQPSPRHRAIP